MDITQVTESHQVGIDVAIAEFNALRAEIVALTTIKATYLGTGLTAAGLILTLALQGSLYRNVILLIPFLALAIVALAEAESVKILRAGRYIRESLWPYLNKASGYPLSWEARWDPIRESRVRTAFLALLESAAPMLLAALSAYTLILQPPTTATALVAAILAVLTTALLPLAVLVIVDRPHRRSGLQESRRSGA